MQPLRYRYDELGIVITVPAGFVTDFASVPRGLWNIVPRWGRHGEAAVLHDYLYDIGVYTRKECDKIFLVAMKECRAKKARIIWAGVRMGGWLAWRNHRKKDAL